ncbi:MAG: T9SS type A sorting domain-containing protein [Ignavibacterium sp.]|nr:T9SS type A sorting domain-containing protein [Ignavibacterium sp.]
MGYTIITGLPTSSLAIRLKVNNNLEPQYAAAVIKSDESVLLKNNPIELNLSGTETVKEYALDQNYPNPFNPSTTIKFQIPKDGFVSLKVYDILGNEITTLVNEEKSQGRYEVIFNASSLANGVYIYKIQSGDFISSKKMILLK